MPIKIEIRAPDSALHITDASYVADVIRRTGLSQRACALRIGVSHATLKNWLAGSHDWPYSAQYTLECLAKFAEAE